MRVLIDLADDRDGVKDEKMDERLLYVKMMMRKVRGVVGCKVRRVGWWSGAYVYSTRGRCMWGGPVNVTAVPSILCIPIQTTPIVTLCLRTHTHTHKVARATLSHCPPHL